MKPRLLSLFVAVAALVMLNGCVIALGNRGIDQENPKAGPTLGKQLTDLKQARESGALTEDEYQTAKKRLLEHKCKP